MIISIGMLKYALYDHTFCGQGCATPLPMLIKGGRNVAADFSGWGRPRSVQKLFHYCLHSTLPSFDCLSQALENPFYRY